MHTRALVSIFVVAGLVHAVPHATGTELVASAASKASEALTATDKGIRHGARRAGDAIDHGVKKTGELVHRGAKKIGLPPPAPASAPK